MTIRTAPDKFVTLTEADTLDGGAVLPGFALPLRDLFAELDEHGTLRVHAPLAGDRYGSKLICCASIRSSHAVKPSQATRSGSGRSVSL